LCSSFDEFAKRNIQILGCSFDTVADNKTFADKFGYQFPLLCDTERKLGMAYGACSKPSAGFASRISFLIDEKGTIIGCLPKVNPATHTSDVLAMLPEA
jgi:peroxiredoxin Q/BCP